MKKILMSAFFSALLLCILFCTAYAYEHAYVYKSVDLPQTESQDIPYSELERYCARFADDKTPIPLCNHFDGKMWAVVHETDKERPIEVFLAEEDNFTDYNPYAENSYHFYVAKPLYYRGVMVGNDKGELLPESNITRAEATAMIMRFIGMANKYNDTAEGYFTDVPADSWYHDTVYSALSCNIVYGDSQNTFSPERLVTREELTAMVARAAVYAGLRNPSDIESYTQIQTPYAEGYDWRDKNEISPWAVASYDTIYQCLNGEIVDLEPVTLENGEVEIPIARYLNPKDQATRYDLADLLRSVLDYYLVLPSEEAIEFGFASYDDTEANMPVIDGSTSTYPFTQAVYGNLFYGGYNHKDMPQKHSKSHVSYQRLINREVDMIFASVYPASDILAMAEEKGVEIELIPIAYDAMIFFTNIDNPAKGLTSEQITDIYVNNAYSNWKDLGGADSRLIPYCRNNDSGSHAQMEKHFLKGKEIHKDIQEETTSVSMSNVLTDVMAAKSDDPLSYGLGYSIYYYYHNMDMFYGTHSTLKLLEIDGVAPTDETIADGSYPLSNNTYIAILKDTPEDAPARKMAEFMLTPKGQDCVEQAGFGKLIK